MQDFSQPALSAPVNQAAQQTQTGPSAAEIAEKKAEAEKVAAATKAATAAAKKKADAEAKKAADAAAAAAAKPADDGLGLGDMGLGLEVAGDDLSDEALSNLFKL